MAGTQLYAYADGTVRECEGWSAPSVKRQNEILEMAFSSIGRFEFEWLEKAGSLRSVRLIYGGKRRTVSFASKSVCGGGRAEVRPRELRVQVQPDVYNQIVEHNLHGNTGLLIGVYVNGDDSALAVWRPMVASAGWGSASKQVGADVVARAMQLGYEMQVYPDGETAVWVGKPELFLAYLDYLELAPPLIGEPSIFADAEMNKVKRNLIYFGAPGTGKSYQLNKKAHELFDESRITRVTFHPDYTYSQFVGSLRPHTDQSEDGKTRVYYAYTPGPFIETYVEAIKNPSMDYLLIIEELNRANPAAVFGDVFQLLDRGVEGESDYPIKASGELRQYLTNRFIGLPEVEAKAGKLSLPSNMYIWATMNSADQGVFPMDTAFKRRWGFHYMGIDDGESVIEDKVIPLGDTGKRARWNELRKEINRILLEARVNEDKLLGPFFIDPLLLNDENFVDAFKSKVLLYLVEDAAKTKKEKVFRQGAVSYSVVAGDFEDEGEGIFKGIADIALDDADDFGQPTAVGVNTSE